MPYIPMPFVVEQTHRGERAYSQTSWWPAFKCGTRWLP